MAANLFEQLEPQDRALVARLVGSQGDVTVFALYLMKTPALPAGFELGHAARAYLDTVRAVLDGKIDLV